MCIIFWTEKIMNFQSDVSLLNNVSYFRHIQKKHNACYMMLFYHDIRINIRLDSWEVIWEYIDLDLLFRNPQKIKIIPCRCAISGGFPIGKMQQKHVDSSKSRSTSTLQILATQHVVCLGYNWGYPMYWAIICYTMAIILVVYPLINGTAILVLKKMFIHYIL